jgi:hypothetical protein
MVIRLNILILIRSPNRSIADWHLIYIRNEDYVCNGSRDSSVGIATRLGDGRSGF